MQPALTYPPARAAAARIEAHLARHAAASAHSGIAAAPVPDTAAIEATIEAAFWASLRREESYLPRISLALVPLDRVSSPLVFERRIQLAAQPLTRLAPAVERPGIHLGVWPDGAHYSVWGATRSLPAWCFVLEVVAPGLLVAKHSRGDDAGKFVNVAVLNGDEIKLIDEQSARLPDCPDLLTSLLGFDTQHASAESLSVLIQLALSMRAHGRGGSLLVVPAGSETWRESMALPLLYSLTPPFSALAEVVDRKDALKGDGQSSASAASDGGWMDAFRRSIDVVAGLTAVDGATVITDRYSALAFGAKIVRRRGSPQVSEVILTEPIEGDRAEAVEPSQLGGTRHLSAAQFVHDQHDAVALVASQDGRFTVFAWSPCEGMVHAHRIETLLL